MSTGHELLATTRDHLAGSSTKPANLRFCANLSVSNQSRHEILRQASSDGVTLAELNRGLAAGHLQEPGGFGPNVISWRSSALGLGDAWPGRIQ